MSGASVLLRLVSNFGEMWWRHSKLLEHISEWDSTVKFKFYQRPHLLKNSSQIRSLGAWRSNHNGDVMMGAMISQIPASRLFTQPLIQAQIKENTQAPRHWPLSGEFTGDRWIPRINGQNTENVSIWWRHRDYNPHRTMGYTHFSAPNVIHTPKGLELNRRWQMVGMSNQTPQVSGRCDFLYMAKLFLTRYHVWGGRGRPVPRSGTALDVCCGELDGSWRTPTTARGKLIKILRPRQNGRHFPDDSFKWIFLNENVWISIEVSLKFVPRGPINNIPALVQIMAWRRPCDNPLSELMIC